MSHRRCTSRHLYTTLTYHLPSLFFFFNDTATTEIYTLSLHDALPIYPKVEPFAFAGAPGLIRSPGPTRVDRKSTRLNSSHTVISYAVFCLKKKKGIKYSIFDLIHNTNRLIMQELNAN